MLVLVLVVLEDLRKKIDHEQEHEHDYEVSYGCSTEKSGNLGPAI